MENKYTVIRDTREQEGWSFDASQSCVGTVSEKLDTGDYSLSGYEDILAVERKGGIGEFAKNVVQDRFEKELQRMEDIKHTYIILEFNMDDLIKYPASLKLNYYQKKKIRLRGSFILKRVIEFSILYKTQILFCGDYGKQVADSIFKRIIEIEGIRDSKDSR